MKNNCLQTYNNITNFTFVGEHIFIYINDNLIIKAPSLYAKNYTCSVDVTLSNTDLLAIRYTIQYPNEETKYLNKKCTYKTYNAQQLCELFI